MSRSTSPEELTGDFDWAVYADATFAGLSILIPIPLVDLAFVAFFRRRMPREIARHRGCAIDPAVVRELNHQPWKLGCLGFPLWLVFQLLRRLYRTVFYFLTVKEASDLLSHHWHRAFLIDLGLRRGHLTDPARRDAAVAAIKQVLDEATTSPLTGLAGQIVSGVSHVLRTTLRWVRRRFEDDVARMAHRKLERAWVDLGGHFDEIAAAYDQAFVRLEALTVPPSRATDGKSRTPRAPDRP